jgi:hypothetical protein
VARPRALRSVTRPVARTQRQPPPRCARGSRPGRMVFSPFRPETSSLRHRRAGPRGGPARSRRRRSSPGDRAAAEEAAQPERGRWRSPRGRKSHSARLAAPDRELRGAPSPRRARARRAAARCTSRPTPR